MFLSWGACSSSSLRVPPTAGGSKSVVDPTEGRTGKQFLFRVQYSGPQGDGSLRLVLRQDSDSFFQLATADALGRSLWSLEVKDASTLFVDHRQQIFCLSDEDVRLGEVTLEMFPLASLPRILLGLMPVELSEGQLDEGSQEYRDGQGRLWSVRTAAATVEAWTLWIDESPTLWWTRQGKGGILSHRDGSQFRWRQVIQESLGTTLAPLTPPESFQEISCHAYDLPEFRQGQSPPTGDGTPR